MSLPAIVEGQPPKACRVERYPDLQEGLVAYLARYGHPPAHIWYWRDEYCFEVTP